MGSFVLEWDDIDSTMLADVGGKGMNLAELSRIEGIRVPPGFCVTTGTYRRIFEDDAKLGSLLDELSDLKADDRERVSAVSERIRARITATEIPVDVKSDVARQLSKLGEESAFAVRSSATAEDLPSASFAGQQDTYLNIKGEAAVLDAVSRCWASLFTDRAVIYRIQNGFDHCRVFLGVVVQRMVFPEVSGIMFTADPATSNREVVSIDAGFGLGEALVSGLVNPDVFRVRDGKIIDRKISTKKLAVQPLDEGGTEERELPPERREMEVLTDEQVCRLESLGRKIESHFGSPQDIEWCLARGHSPDLEANQPDEVCPLTFYVVQSRPITTLFPIPQVEGAKPRVFFSVGHQEMMTKEMLPLGISFFSLISDDIPMYQAGGRLYLDLTYDLASPLGRKILLAAMGRNDPLVQDAIHTLLKRKGFLRSLPRGKRYLGLRTEGLSAALPLEALKIYRRNDPGIVEELFAKNEASLRELRKRIADVSGEALFDFIRHDHQRLKDVMYNPTSTAAIMVELYAAGWINRKMWQWLGEKSAADTLSQSVPNNVTSEMGLALLDVSDVVRKFPQVIAYFQQPREETFFEDLAELEGGEEVSESIREYLDKYGMRCPAEIDITRTRWSENPAALVPMILSNVKNLKPGAHHVKFEQGRLEALHKENELLQRLEQLPGGKRKARKTRKMISVLRNFTGYREYPKYALIKRHFIYKLALLREAEKLVREGVIREKEDVYYLTFQEFREAVRTGRLDYGVIKERKEEYKVFEKLTPPRVLTSEGECINGEYNNTGSRPAGALPGIPVSSGTVEGRARVALRIEDAHIEEGDILVTTFTDPSWTPVFVSIKGLVTEVGGVMTHGAVIAREYGLPAVVGVDNATKIIKEGERIRVNGTEGYVQVIGWVLSN